MGRHEHPFSAVVGVVDPNAGMPGSAERTGQVEQELEPLRVCVLRFAFCVLRFPRPSAYLWSAVAANQGPQWDVWKRDGSTATAGVPAWSTSVLPV